MPKMKRCSNCGNYKHMSSYHNDKRNKDGKVYVCKDCIKCRCVDWYSKNKNRSEKNRKSGELIIEKERMNLQEYGERTIQRGQD